MKGWKRYRLSDIMKIIGGGTPKTNKPEYWGGDIPWLSVKDFGNGIKCVYATEKCITDKGLEESSTKVLKKGQLIISARGTVGEIAQLGKDMAFNQSCYGLDANENVCTNDYLYYLLKFKIADIRRNTHGAVFDTITRNTFNSIEVALPSLSEQKFIAETLSALDDKIELNNRINKNLEAITQAIFKRWFIDFEFPNEDGKPYKSSGGLFQNSMLGRIPAGWSIERFANQINIERGLSYKGSGLCSEAEGIPMHNLNSVYEGGGYKYDGIKYYNGEYKNRHLLRPWDIIVTNTEQGHKYLLIGCPAVVPRYFGDTGIFSQHIFKVTSKETITNQFIYYLLLTPYIREQVIGCTNGTTVNMLSKDGLEMPLFTMPPKDLIDKFSEIVIPIWGKKEAIYKENQNLSKLRDALVPKLMSGKLTVTQPARVTV